MERVPDTRYTRKITGRIVGCHRNQWYNAGTKKDPSGDSGWVFIGTSRLYAVRFTGLLYHSKS